MVSHLAPGGYLPVVWKKIEAFSAYRAASKLVAFWRFLATGEQYLRVHSATASSFKVISNFYELDIYVFLRSVDSLFFFVDPELLVFGIRISDYARLS